ncbi:hypothetical protein D3C71_890790 [compost metagenome]
MQRLLHARLGCAFAQLAAAVVFAIGNHRPTVVAARLGLVEFVATLRAVLVHPQLAVWPQRCTLGVAVAVAPDLGQGARLFGERVVGRHGPFGGDADDLAVVVVELLGIVLAVVAVTQGQEQVAVRRLHDAAAKMQAAFDLGPLAEDHLDVLQAASILGQRGPGQRRAVAACARRCGLGKTKEDAAVAGKGSVRHHIQQAALPACCHSRHPGQWGADLPAGTDNPHAPRPLSDQKLPLRQKGHRPRVIQALGHGHQRHRRCGVLGVSTD